MIWEMSVTYNVNTNLIINIQIKSTCIVVCYEDPISSLTFWGSRGLSSGGYPPKGLSEQLSGRERQIEDIITIALFL